MLLRLLVNGDGPITLREELPLYRRKDSGVIPAEDYATEILSEIYGFGDVKSRS